MFPERIRKRMEELGFKPGKPFFYVSGALSNLEASERERIKGFYERIASIVEKHGGFAYVPHRFTDPKVHKDVTPKEVYEVDMAAVHKTKGSGAVIAVVDRPSLGVGAEIEKASREGIPIIMVHHQDVYVSRLPRGSSQNIIEIGYKDFGGALNKLDKVIRMMLKEGKRVDEIKKELEG